MNDLESPEICDLVYVGQFADLNSNCKTNLNGLLQTGLTNAFAFMFRAIQLDNMKYENLGPTANRTLDQLKAMLNET